MENRRSHRPRGDLAGGRCFPCIRDANADRAAAAAGTGGAARRFARTSARSAGRSSPREHGRDAPARSSPCRSGSASRLVPVLVDWNGGRGGGERGGGERGGGGAGGGSDVCFHDLDGIGRGATGQLVVVVFVGPAERGGLHDGHFGRRLARHRVHRRARRLEGGGPLDLGGHRAHPGRGLHRLEDLRPVAPDAGLGVGRAEVDGSIQDPHGALGVSATKEHLAEPAVHLRVARRRLPGRHEHGLRVPQPLCGHVHARGRQEDRGVAGVVTRSARTHFLDQRPVRRAAQRLRRARPSRLRRAANANARRARRSNPA